MDGSKWDFILYLPTSPLKSVGRPFWGRGSTFNSSSGDKGEDPEQKQAQGQDQKNSKDQKQSEKQEDDKEKTHERTDEGQKAEQDTPRDLSGELRPLQAMAEQDEDQTPDQPGAVLDRKKAEALLDNLKEDRSRFLRFQIPEDKKRGVKSGKDW